GYRAGSSATGHECPALGVETGATNQQAVHIRRGHELGRAVHVDASAVEHRNLARALAYLLQQRGADPPVHFTRIMWHGGAPGADGPYGLVREQHACHLRPVELRDALAELSQHNGAGLVPIALLLTLAHAQHRNESDTPGGCALACGHRICLTEELSPFRVANERHGGAGLVRHGQRRLSGEGPLLLPENVLHA